MNVQCKAYKNYPPISKIGEVPHQEGKIPVLVAKGDRLTPVVVLPLADFVRILEDIGIVYDE